VHRLLPLASTALAPVIVLAACGGASPPAANGADATFLTDMTSHHAQAIAAAQIAETRGSDPRVRAFARRIVAEQTPELQRMDAAAAAAHLHLSAGEGAAMAVHRIDAADIAQLRTLTGTAFDRRFLSLSITSEQGAVTMAKAELAGGTDQTARTIAGPISGADHSEIPQLQALLASID
jgi:uncharacterized protein (DUF305 family)